MFLIVLFGLQIWIFMQIHMMFDLLLFVFFLVFFVCLFVEVFVFGGCLGRTRIAWHVYLQIYLGFDF
jgi:hypothetical protein